MIQNKGAPTPDDKGLARNQPLHGFAFVRPLAIVVCTLLASCSFTGKMGANETFFGDALLFGNLKPKEERNNEAARRILQSTKGDFKFLEDEVLRLGGACARSSVAVNRTECTLHTELITLVFIFNPPRHFSSTDWNLQVDSQDGVTIDRLSVRYTDELKRLPGR